MIEGAKFFYKKSGKLLDTTEGPKDAKWIFVLSTSKSLYVGQKNKGTFQHSSFLAGGATLSAGRLVVENGILKVKKKPWLCVSEELDSFTSSGFCMLMRFIEIYSQFGLTVDITFQLKKISRHSCPSSTSTVWILEICR